MSKSELLNFASEQLKELGYRGKILDDSSVGSAASGLKFIISIYDGSIQLSCIFNKSDEDGFEDQLIRANNFNKEIRFSSLYVNDDGDLVLEAHWLLDPADENARKTFGAIMDILELALDEVKGRIWRTKRGTGLGNDEGDAS